MRSDTTWRRPRRCRSAVRGTGAWDSIGRVRIERERFPRVARRMPTHKAGRRCARNNIADPRPCHDSNPITEPTTSQASFSLFGFQKKYSRGEGDQDTTEYDSGRSVWSHPRKPAQHHTQGCMFRQHGSTRVPDPWAICACVLIFVYVHLLLYPRATQGPCIPIPSGLGTGEVWSAIAFRCIGVTT